MGTRSHWAGDGSKWEALVLMMDVTDFSGGVEAGRGNQGQELGMINRLVWKMSAKKGSQSWPHTRTTWKAFKTLAAWPGWKGVGGRVEASLSIYQREINSYSYKKSMYTYVFASLMAQMVKNLPVMWETWV